MVIFNSYVKLPEGKALTNVLWTVKNLQAQRPLSDRPLFSAGSWTWPLEVSISWMPTMMGRWLSSWTGKISPCYGWDSAEISVSSLFSCDIVSGIYGRFWHQIYEVRPHRDIPSGYLLHSHGKWPIYRWFMVYLLKMVIFHGNVSHNQMVIDKWWLIDCDWGLHYLLSWTLHIIYYYMILYVYIQKSCNRDTYEWTAGCLEIFFSPLEDGTQKMGVGRTCCNYTL